MTKEPGKPRENATGPRPEANKLLDVAPDRLPLTERRAKYLADLAGVQVRTITGKTIADAHEALRWRLDPLLFLFRRICGRVVKKDPVTGDLLPVPNATVHVEDTDCSFLGYFPRLSPYVWLYPFRCRREEIATVRTDDCGRFCVYLPFWDIDRILRWRRMRVCLWEYYRPRIRDIVERIPEPRIGPMPGGPPLPDPPRIRRIAPEALEQLRGVAGDAVVQRLEAASHLVLQGERTTVLDDVLDTPLFAKAVPPPLPEQLATRKELQEVDVATLGLDPRIGIEKIDIRALVGPFLRCFDIFVPVWQTVLDVPDITFQVTQDYDNDGVEEVVYSEGFFDVRWNSGSIPDVTLEASALAVATANCGPVVEIACANVASIEAAGYLDLEPAYHDDAHGYGLRVNRPTNNGDYPAPSGTGIQTDPATAPYWGNLNLHGCVRIANATHYRLKYEYRAKETDPWGAATTFLGVTWMAPRQGPGAPIPFVPDANGWYPIVDPAVLVHPNWLLPWYTPSRADGIYRLELELGRLTGGAIHSAGTSAKRVFRVDNQNPSASLTEVRWRLASLVGPWNDMNSTRVLPAPASTCPVIHRPAGQDIDLRVVWTASATHLRNAELTQWGCGGGGLVPIDSGGDADYRHWHTGPNDNNIVKTNHYLLPAGRPPGCYTLGIHAWSRAFNPQDFDAASTHDWWVNQGWNWAWPSWAISVVNV